MHRAILFPLATLAFAGLVAPSLAGASPARTAALAESPLFPDSEDVLAFPSSAPRWTGLFEASVGDGLETGTAGLLFGDQVAVGLFVGRPEGAEDLRRRAEVYPGVDITVPHRLFDLAVALRIDGQHSAGLGLGVSHVLDRASNADFGDNGALAASVGVAAGHTWERDDGARADTSLGLDFSYFRRTTRFEVTQEVPVSPALQLRHRSIWPVMGRFSVGVAAALRRDSLDVELPASERSAKGGAAWTSLEVGPRIQASPDVVLAVSLLLERRSWTVEDLDSPPRRAEGGSQRVDRIPAVRAAVEARPTDWMTARLGLRGGRRSVHTEDGAGNSAVRSDAEAAWTAGVGLELGGLVLDGVVTGALLQGGPDFIGGTAPGLFSLVSAHYDF